MSENVWQNSNMSERVWQNARGNPGVVPHVSSEVNTSNFLEVMIRKELQRLFQPVQNQRMPAMGWPAL